MTPSEQILQYLERYRYLTTPQVYELFGLPRKHDENNTKQRGKRDTLKRFLGRLWKRKKVDGPFSADIYAAFSDWLPASPAHESTVTDVHLFLEGKGDLRGWKQTDIKHNGINPDAYFWLNGCYYFLEVERQPNGFKKRSGAVKKAERYLEYKAQGEFIEPTMRDFFVLFIVENDIRRNNLLKALPPYGTFKVATVEDLKNNTIYSPNGKVSTI